MRHTIFFVFFVSFVSSCKNDINLNSQKNYSNHIEISDQSYVVDTIYQKGDVRRYGIYPNRSFSNKTWNQVVHLASKGMPITFQKGMYRGNFIFSGLDNITMHFKDATLAGGIQIINNENIGSKNINLLGKLTVLDKVFIKQSQSIKFDNLSIVSDTIHNIYNKKNRGFSIYAGSKNITVDTLKIIDTGGSSDPFYKYSASALQVHGYNNNPEDININYLHIKDVARTALYLTGNNHHIKKIDIDNFGFGSNSNMFGLEDAKPKSQEVFAGAWFNKCNDCTVDTLVINAQPNSKIFSAKFGLGVYSKPCIINNIQFNKRAQQMPIEDDLLTNVLVKRVLNDYY